MHQKIAKTTDKLFDEIIDLMQICHAREFKKIIHYPSIFSKSVKILLREGFDPNLKLSQGIEVLRYKRESENQRRQLSSIINTKSTFYYVVLIISFSVMLWQQNLIYLLNILLMSLSICLHTLSTLIIKSKIQKIKTIDQETITQMIEEFDFNKQQKLHNEVQIRQTKNIRYMFKTNQILPLWEFTGIFLSTLLCIAGPMIDFLKTL